MAWGRRAAPADQQYDMPNMDAVRCETRRLDDPKADYPLAVQAREAQQAGARRRGSHAQAA
jgi:hypothetical protein